MRRRQRRLPAHLAALLCFGVAVLAVVGWTTLDHGGPALSAATRARLDGASDRGRKTDLIERLDSPPEVVILGGSRALRFDPAYLWERTGLSGFNAAVTDARPEDAWALVSLLHERFPSARFRFLWVIHADEFDPKGLDSGLVYDAALARFFPPSLIRRQMLLEAAHLVIDPMQEGRVFAADGCVVRDDFDRIYPQPGRDACGVRSNIRAALQTYAKRPAQLSRRSVFYFEQTLALMQSIAAAPPVIVSAPVDPRILAATINHGWAVRQGLLLRLLASLHAHYRFSFDDLSRASSCGCTAADFFDGIHLRPSGARKVIDAVLSRFPNAFPSFDRRERAKRTPTASQGG
jgi:hypothetical protein